MPRKFSEELTHKEITDPQLEQAGWYLRDHSKVKTEIPVDGYDKESLNGEVLTRQLESNTTQYNYNVNLIRFLRTMQSVFLQKRHLETADLYDMPSLAGFGQDAVEKWFTEREVEEIVNSSKN
jgi:hypothetical protein